MKQQMPHKKETRCRQMVIKIDEKGERDRKRQKETERDRKKITEEGGADRRRKCFI